MGHLGALLISLLFMISFSLASSEIVPDDLKDVRSTYIVRVQNDMKPSPFSDVEEWYKATLQSLDSNPLTNSENPKPIQAPLHVYSTVMQGFSARLTKQQATQLSNTPGVVAVLPDTLLQLHTTRTPYFLGLSDRNNNINEESRLLSESDSGSSVTIGFLDTGIWPEHRSFHDEGMDPIPLSWKGECVGGANFTKDNCNKKIIGARFFSEGYKVMYQELDPVEQVNSTRDIVGHGTHMASIAAGRAVVGASVFGHANGTAVGIAPKARIAVYKVCWKKGCAAADVLGGFDKAVKDGVDVISISLGVRYTLTYYLDPYAIGAFGAMEMGVTVIASAGNSGPSNLTVINVAPWMMTVGASTIDRGFPADLVLADGQVINGASLYNGSALPKNTSLSLIYAGKCVNVSSSEARGKIVVCDRGGLNLSAKGEAVQKAGGIGVVVENALGVWEDLLAIAHVIPGLSINQSAGVMLRDYISNSSPNASATIVFHGTELGIKPAPVVASFSARGPNLLSSYVLKPDVIAPGVNILAAWPDGVPPTELLSDRRSTEFNILSGTSMSSPHVAGVAALLKGAHPDWSPAMIKSSMMTTAYTLDKQGNPILDNQEENITSTVWDMGSGHIDPEKAVDPGLVYGINSDDYLIFLCASGYEINEIRTISNSSSISCGEKQSKPWDLNYPSISVEFKASDILVINRTVTYVGEGPANYSVTVTNPGSGFFNMTVDPMRMEFKIKGENQTYSVRINATSAPGVDRDVGKIVWSDGKREVVSPVAAMLTE